MTEYRRGYKLRDLIKLTWAYSGNDNPMIFILNDNTDDSTNAIEPNNVFIDDDGDIIIQVDEKLLKG